MTSLYLGNSIVPTAEDISLPVTLIMADIRDPGKIDTNHTLTVSIPFTPESHTFFEFIGTPATALQTFNPNLKNSAKIVKNGSVILRGYVQLLNTVENLSTGVGYYKCKIQGLNAELIYSIGEKYLVGNDNPSDDLDFSSYDHIINTTNVKSSWAGTPGIGYRYPLADYGYAGSGVNGNYTNFYVNHLRPVLFAYEYLLKIFEAAGKTFTSSFLSGSFFKTLVVPGTKPIGYTDDQLADNNCYVGIAGPGAVSLAHGMTHAGFGVWNIALPQENPIQFDEESAGDFYDSNNLYNPGNGEITVNTAGRYRISTNTFTGLTIDTPSGTDNVISADFFLRCRIQQFIGGVWTDVALGTPTSGTFPTGSISPIVEYIEVVVDCVAGDRFRVATISQAFNVAIEDNLGNPMTTGPVDMVIATEAAFAPITPIGGTFKLEFETDYIGEGYDVEMSEVIPEGIKQKDFFLSIVKMFNLMVMEDPNDENNYLIEPDPTFYGADTVDWTSKLDTSRDREVFPMGELNFKRLLYTYKNDSDYYNKLYQDSYKEAYGTYKAELPTEFPTSEKKTELIFSATPLVGNIINALRIPFVYKADSGTPEPQKFNIRIWQWGGVIDIPSYSTWTLKSSAGDQTFYPDAANVAGGGYPYAGHLDDPYNPTMDLCFDNPKEVYWHQAAQYTGDNLYSIYHNPMIEEISNKDSKTVKMYFDLNETDIAQFDFRNYVMVLGTRYIVNAIRNFNANDRGSTLVELLKLTS